MAPGLKLLAEDHFDVVLLDINLPDSKSLEALSSALQQAPSTPFVILSGLDDETTPPSRSILDFAPRRLRAGLFR